MGQLYLMLLLAALIAVPGCALVLIGGLRHRPLLQGVGVLVGTVVGVELCWWGGHVAARRLAGRGAELMDLLRLGAQAKARDGRRPGPELSRGKSAALGALWTLGILCVVPQGLVPVAFDLLGVDPQVKAWFVARYLPQDVQMPVAIGFVALGALALWWAASIRRGSTGQAGATAKKAT